MSIDRGKLRTEQFLRRVITRTYCEKVVEIIISWQAIKEAIYKNAQIQLEITDVYVTYSDLTSVIRYEKGR